MRHESLYLEDIRDAADSIARFIAGLDDEAALCESDMVSSAVVHKLAVIGEASARLSPGLKARHPEVAWAEIVAFRNILVHAYFGIDWSVVWLAVSVEIPMLRRQVAGILETEFGGAGTAASTAE
jgi:uncharacterized protein with HEPN domain